MSKKRIRIYIRGGYIKRMSFIRGGGNGKEVRGFGWEKKRNEIKNKELVGGRKNDDCGGKGEEEEVLKRKKKYIILGLYKPKPSSSPCVICRAWRKCVESLTR